MDIITLILSKLYTNKVVKSLAGGLKYQGSKPKVSDLPTPSASNKGHMYTVLENGHEYVSDGSQWVDLGADLDKKVDKPYEPVAGQGVNVPYYFDVDYAADKVTVNDYTVDLLDKSKAAKKFSLDINAATNEKAGLMTASDKAALDNKLNILPKVDDPTDPGFGWEYHIPYNFIATPDSDKLNIKLKTLTLDNKFTKMDFDQTLPSATATTAGLMTAADKVALDGKQDKLTAGANVKIENNTISVPIEYVELTGTSGTLTDAQATTLSNVLSYIMKDNVRYNYVKTELMPTITYAATVNGYYNTIVVDFLTKNWSSTSTQIQEKLTAGANITITDNVISATGGGSDISYINLTGWNETAGWHEGGTLTDAQAATLASNELNYIWMNNMHRLDFRYKDDNNDLSTYSASDGTKTHVIKIIPSTKAWYYSHNELQGKMSAGDGIGISDANAISVKADTADTNGTIVVSSTGVKVNPDLTVSTITSTGNASFNNDAIEVRKLANTKNGIIGNGGLVLNKKSGYIESAIGENSTILGTRCFAKNEASMATGIDSEAGGTGSFAMNMDTRAQGVGAFAQGHQTIAKGYYAQAFGERTSAMIGNQTAIGYYNKPNNDSILMVGNGEEQGKTSGRSQASHLIGFYTFNPDSTADPGRWTEITADNCQSIWDDTTITKVYKLQNAFEVSKTGMLKSNGLTDGTTEIAMNNIAKQSDVSALIAALGGLKLQQISQAAYDALPTPRDANTMFIIVG